MHSIRLAAACLLALSLPAWGAGMVEARVVVAPGVVLRMIEAGPKDTSAPIVFIPGWSTGADIWRGQMKRLATRRRVISFDPRSQGASTVTTRGNTPEQRAADLHTLLMKGHVDRPVLVAWSQAVQDVAAYALRYGTKDISGIVLVDAPVASGANAIAEQPKRSADQFRLFGIYQSDQEVYLRGMFGAIISKPQPPGVVDRAVATGMKTPPSIGVAMLVSDMFGPDRRGALAKLACPVLFIAAARSQELDLQKAQAEEVDNAQFVRIDDAAHAVFVDQPDRFALVLRAFLKGLGGPA